MVDDLKAAVKAATDTLASLTIQRDAEIEASRREILVRWNPEVTQAQEALRGAEKALREALSATATHPWEGKRLKTQKWDSSGWRGKHIDVYGVLEVRRLSTEFPSNLSRWNTPAMGEPFVRLLKKDGNPGSKIDRNWRQWKLVEEQTNDA